MDELLAECCRAVRTLVTKSELEFDLKTENELLFHGDETLIRRLIMNLLDNAIKYTPASGEVSVSCQSSGDIYEIKFRNTGEAIPLEARSRVFERFYRTDKARSRVASRNGVGAGLGLSIGKWIAKAHDGRLELLDSDDSETVFVVILPSVTEK